MCACVCVCSWVFLLSPTGDTLLWSCLSSSMEMLLVVVDCRHSVYVCVFCRFKLGTGPSCLASVVLHISWVSVGMILQVWRLIAGAFRCNASRLQNVEISGTLHFLTAMGARVVFLRINNIPAAPFFRVSAVTSLPITMATQHSLHYCNSCRVCLCTRESVCLDSLRPMNWSQCDRTLCSSESWSSGDWEKSPRGPLWTHLWICVCLCERAASIPRVVEV